MRKPRVQGAVIGMVSLVCTIPLMSVASAETAGTPTPPAAPAATKQGAKLQLAQAGETQFERERAGELERGETVTERSRPELDPLGLQLGGFTAFPRLEVGEIYNDNIFATEDDEEDDLITRIRPSVLLRSNWAVHELNFRADATIDRYSEFDDENTEDYRVGFDGELEITRDSRLRGGADFRNLHQLRGDPDDVAAAEEPTEYDRITADTEYLHNFGRFNVAVGGVVDTYDFDDVRTVNGALINNDDRDRNEYEGIVRLGYEIVPDYEAFIRGSYNVRDYDADVDDAGLDRDSDGYETVAGIAVDFGGITFGDFFVGYRSQEYDDPQLEKIDGVSAGAAITWNVTPLTTVIGTLERSIRETTIVGASGRFVTEIGLSVDHELLRNLLLGAEASYRMDDFEGIDREDDIYRAGVSANYLLNRNFSVSAGYVFERRTSDVAIEEYDQNIAQIRLVAQY